MIYCANEKCIFWTEDCECNFTECICTEENDYEYLGGC